MSESVNKIWIVEDDDNIRDMVVYALASARFDAEGFTCGEEFWRALDKGVPSLLLLDIMLPGEDGIAILKALKKSAKYSAVPVIMLTAKGTEYDRIMGLDLGADDYITKPFSVMETISRVRAVLRRYPDSYDATATLEIGDVFLNADKRSVLAGGVEIPLTFREFELLQYLMLNEGIVLTRDKLLEQVWDFDYNGESRTVDMHIRALRRKLGDYSNMIKTIRNVGYKIEG